MRTNSWVKPWAVLRLGSTKTRMGRSSDSLTSSSTLSVMVAEKSMVCRERGHALMISSSSSVKPASSIRSASSMTSTSRADRVNDGVLVRWSISRPGVAISTSGRVRKVCA
jgi:hypothetical protein